METKQILLEGLRKQIDLVDALIIRCLAKRLEIVKEVAEIKKRENLPIFQPEREMQMLEKRKGLAIANGVSSLLIENIFKNILESSREEQNKLAGRCRYY